MTQQQKTIYDKYLERLRLKLIAKYDELGLRASGKYEEALEPIVTNSSMIMYGANHSQFMERGRGIGPANYKKLAPFIQQWIEVKKGLPSVFYEKKKAMSFAIAHKIANEGIRVPNKHNKGKVIEMVVNDFLANDIYEMMQELGDVFITRIQADVSKVFKEEILIAT